LLLKLGDPKLDRILTGGTNQADSSLIDETLLPQILKKDASARLILMQPGKSTDPKSAMKSLVYPPFKGFPTHLERFSRGGLWSRGPEFNQINLRCR
jgi:hypothetical protein